jgi:hypothetical protein
MRSPISGSASGNGGAVASTGGGTGGRASHVAAFVGGTGPQGKIVVAGGNTFAGASDTITRYNVDANTFTHTTAFTTQMANPRVGHAAAFSIDPTTQATRVLACGGAASGTATASADVYAFTPTEQVTSTPFVGAMSTARTQHTLTPNRRQQGRDRRRSQCWATRSDRSKSSTRRRATSPRRPPSLRRAPTISATLLPERQHPIAGGDASSARPKSTIRAPTPMLAASLPVVRSPRRPPRPRASRTVGCSSRVVSTTNVADARRIRHADLERGHLHAGTRH